MKDSSDIPLERRLDELASQFEVDWTEDQRPDFEGFLEQIDEAHRSQLLNLLLDVDVELRLKANQAVSPDEYKPYGAQAIQRVKGALDSIIGPTKLSVKPQQRVHESKLVGPFKLLQQIGEGGMGTVWMADQEKPIKRRVALKVIKAGMDSKQVIARFEAERQALAMMDHQNIAKVLDAGMTEDGRPYFAMELVQGIPITDYCDKNRLTPNERLELFVPICNAIQHAHQKSIIHRDLKPSNVLVTMYDGNPVPKVIDFGLAKALQHQTQLTDKTMFTEFGQVVGTLQYMSPEQAEMNALDVDTRTDIYSLGVMLYELLTGSTPLDKDTLHGNALLKVLEAIKEQEPQRPSTRLSTSGDAITGISEQRQITPSKLQQILRGELDWIVMKAIDKDRARRYESASDFGQEIMRYLNDEPVQAKPPSAAYLVSKFVKKNRRLVAAIGSIAALLVLGIASTTWFAFASQKATEAAKENQLKAEKSAEQTERVLKLMISSFKSPDPSVKGRDVTIASILDQAVETFKTDPEIDDVSRIRLLQSIAGSYRGLGLYAEEQAVDEYVIPMIRERFGENHVETINAMANYATTLSLPGTNLQSADIAKRSLGLRRTHYPNDFSSIVKDLNALADIHMRLGQNQAASAAAKEAVELATKHQISQDQQLSSKQTLAYSLQAQGKYGEACQSLEKVHQSLVKLKGPEHPKTLRSVYGLAIALSYADRIPEATSLLETNLPLMQSVLGKDHSEVLNSMNVLAVCYHQLEQPQKGLELAEQVAELFRNKYPADHFERLSAEHNLAMAYQNADEPDKAKQAYIQVHQQMKESLGENHVVTLRAGGNLALVYRSLNELDECIEAFRENARLREASQELGPHHPETLWSKLNLGEAYLLNQEAEKAIEILEPLLELLKKEFGESDENTIETRKHLKNARKMLGEK